MSVSHRKGQWWDETTRQVSRTFLTIIMEMLPPNVSIFKPLGFVDTMW